MTMKQTLNIQRLPGYAIVQLDHGKVNAIDELMARELAEVFEELEADEKVKGLILAGRPHCFSAGLDVFSLLKGGTAGAKSFWYYYQKALQAMVRFSKPFVCAITGYAPAGATILALAADYRVMGKGLKHVVGMHEFNMSMLIPEMLSDVYAYHLGEQTAWKYVQQARLFNSDEAKAIGLVDESVEVEEVMERAQAQLKRLMKVQLPVYQKSKRYFRKGLLQIVNRDLEQMAGVIAKDAEDPAVQESLKQFLANLKLKSKKPI
ncbi:MAG: enoyl-CoA hydratase/isomerase family protein [Bacteroidetes bacterium]|nr:MAG: enoyl-CoA hydratase/isomerase family protein [Bacteroidota bacterium]